MGKHSFIGPIDPQFVLDTQLGRMPVPAHAIREQFEMAKEECRDQGLLPSWIPVLRQYGPALIIQCQLAIDLSQSLVGDWLGRYMFSRDVDGANRGRAVAAALANHATFKSHGRFISREQARTLGLTVDNLEDDPKLEDLLLSVFHATTHTFSATPAVKLIENHNGRAFIKQQQVVVVQQPSGRGGPSGPPPSP
jgi:hypothetical protein